MKPRHMSHRALKSVQSFFLQGTARKKGEKKKGKERHKKSCRRYISPIRGEAPPWTDFYQILHLKRYAGHDHMCKFWCEKIRGSNTEGSNFGFSH